MYVLFVCALYINHLLCVLRDKFAVLKFRILIDITGNCFYQAVLYK